MFRNGEADDNTTKKLRMILTLIGNKSTLAHLCCLLCTSALFRLLFLSFPFHKLVPSLLVSPLQ